MADRVFVGSYDRNLHAFDAKTGDTRWTASAPGRISGSPTIVGGTVYFADLDERYTTGVSTRTGKQVFQRKPGYFDPITSDGRWLFQTGGYSVTALRPLSAAVAERRAARAKRERREAKERAQAKKQRAAKRAKKRN